MSHTVLSLLNVTSLGHSDVKKSQQAEPSDHSVKIRGCHKEENKVLASHEEAEMV